MRLALALALALLSPIAIAQSRSVCYRGSLDAHGQFQYVEVPCAPLPDAPSAVAATSPRPTLLSWDRNTSPFRTRTFDAALAAEAAATFADAAITHLRANRTYSSGHLCYEANTSLARQPTNGALWRQDGIPVAAQLGLLYIAGRYTWLPITWGSFAYGTAIHARGAYSWRGCN